MIPYFIPRCKIQKVEIKLYARFPQVCRVHLWGQTQFYILFIFYIHFLIYFYFLFGSVTTRTERVKIFTIKDYSGWAWWCSYVIVINTKRKCVMFCCFPTELVLNMSNLSRISLFLWFCRNFISHLVVIGKIYANLIIRRIVDILRSHIWCTYSINMGSNLCIQEQGLVRYFLLTRNGFLMGFVILLYCTLAQLRQ